MCVGFGDSGYNSALQFLIALGNNYSCPVVVINRDRHSKITEKLAKELNSHNLHAQLVTEKTCLNERGIYLNSPNMGIAGK